MVCAPVLCRPFIPQLARLERLVAKQEELLRDYRPPVHVAPLDPELKRKVYYREGEEQGVLGVGTGVKARGGRGGRGHRPQFLACLWLFLCCGY